MDFDKRLSFSKIIYYINQQVTNIWYKYDIVVYRYLLHFLKSNLKRMIIQIYFGNCAVLQYTLHFREGMLIERSLSFSANAVR